METENKIIKAFIRENRSMTIREMSKRIKADYRITHTAAQRLIKKKAVLATAVGKSSLCSLNSSYYGTEIYLVETERREEILKNKNKQTENYTS